MPRPNYLEQVRSRIISLKPGSIFTAADFSDIADTKSIHMCLSRLSDDLLVRKVARGIYLKPRFSAMLNEELPARPDDIAQAIARNYGWTIIPSEATALNLLGLSTQIPAKWQYVSDGPYKEYRIGNTSISFKHTNKSTEITKVSYKTAIVIRALKALGKENISDAEIRTISERLSDAEKQALISESKYCTAWIYEIIKRICREKNDA